MKLPGLDPAVRMGIQGAAAVALVAWINSLLGLDRPYWGALMAVVVIAGSWGENLGKLKGLFLGTALAVAGSLLLLSLAGGSPAPIIAACLICLAVWAYYTPVSYAASCASMGAFAILAVSFLQKSSHEIALARALQVFLGGGLGILVSALVLPVRVENELRRHCRELERYLRDTLRTAFAACAGKAGCSDPGAAVELFRRSSRMMEMSRLAVAENLIFPARRRDSAGELDRTRRFVSSGTGLLESLAACRQGELRFALGDFFAAAAALVDRAFAAAAGPSAAVFPEEDLAVLREIFARAVGREGEEVSRRDLGPYLMVFFYIRGIVENAAGLRAQG